MPELVARRGARPTPRSVLAAARPHVAAVGAPATFLVKPAQISMWGNDVHGDCVTAEEAFAKACNSPEIFVSDAQVIAWATAHNVLEGAYLTDVMTWMQTDGFDAGAVTYDDGTHYTVDWTSPAGLQGAIASGPVKLGVAADQLNVAWNSTGGRSGWFGTGFHADNNEDHCVSLCGYGSISWLAQQIGATVPNGVDGTKPGYALFTWNTIGIIDAPSMVAITAEAWLRQPTTVTHTNGLVFTDISSADVGTVLHLVGVSGGNLYHTIRNADGTWHSPFGLIQALERNNPGAFTQISCAGVGNALHVIGIVGGNLWHTIRNADGSWFPTFGLVEAQEHNNPGAFTQISCAGVGNALQVVGLVAGKPWHTIRYADGTWSPTFGDVESVVHAAMPQLVGAHH